MREIAVRSARSTLSQRCEKKLLEKTSWYKQKREDDEEEDMGEQGRRKRRKGGKEREEKKKGNNCQGKVKAVIFAPYTHHSELAEELKQAEEICKS